MRGQSAVNRLLTLMLLGALSVLSDSDWAPARSARADPLSTACPAPQPALWEVRNRSGNTPYMYLFGSIHFGHDGMYPLPHGIESAFERARTLVVEVALDELDGPTVTSAIQRFALLPANHSLQAAVPESLWSRLSAEQEGLPWRLADLNRYRPWFVATLLTSVAMSKLKLTEPYGVDRYFLQQARAKRVIALETLEHQIEALAGLDANEAERFLGDALNALEAGGGYLADLVGAWCAGKARALHQLMHAQLNASGLKDRVYEKLFTARNRTMAGRLAKLSPKDDGQPYFVVVGAGHMLGPSGIVNAMRSEGRNVRRASR